MEPEDTPTPTGRLFRSLRAQGDAANAAVPALDLDEVMSLRSVSLAAPDIAVVGGDHRGSAGPSLAAAAAVAAATPPPIAPAPSLTFEEPPPQPSLWARDPAVPAVPAVPAEQLAAGPTVRVDTSAPVTVDTTASRGRHATNDTGLPGGAVWLIVIGATVAAAWIEVLTLGPGLTWLTGAILVLASAVCAVLVRREDSLVAVIAPPLAFFLATVTAGQVYLPSVGSLVVREAYMIVTTLGRNAAWIFGATALALVIVLVRRWRARAPRPATR